MPKIVFQKNILQQEIGLPPYLVEFLEDLDPPVEMTPNWLRQVGYDVLRAKQSDVEMTNAAAEPRLRKRVPETLNFDEISIVLAYIMPWRSIEMATGVTLLGMYEYSGDRAGLYTVNPKVQQRVVDYIARTYRTKQIQDVLEKIERLVPDVKQTADPNRTIVNNGIYNRKTKTLEPFDPKYVYIAKIATNYVHDAQPQIIKSPDGYVWDVDSWIKELALDDDTNTLLWQVISDFVQSGRTRNKSIWFYSQRGNNGKGTFGQLLKTLVGELNYASLSVEQFNHEFYKSKLIGVVGVIGDENNADKYIDAVPDFKAAVSGDDVMINRKYAEPINYQFKGTIIQMINGLPRTKDKTDSFYRRIILVPFLKSFTNNGERPYIKNDYIKRPEVLEYILYKALNMDDFAEFIIPAKSSEALEDYKEINNPVIQFWNEISYQFKWDLLPTQFLYDLFASWYKRNNPNGKIMNKRSFIDGLALHLESDPKWAPSFKSVQKSNNKMNDDEPLITEYRLTSWMNPNVFSNNQTKIRDFQRASGYRGVIRR